MANCFIVTAQEFAHGRSYFADYKHLACTRVYEHLPLFEHRQRQAHSLHAINLHAPGARHDQNFAAFSLTFVDAPSLCTKSINKRTHRSCSSAENIPDQLPLQHPKGSQMLPGLMVLIHDRLRHRIARLILSSAAQTLSSHFPVCSRWWDQTLWTFACLVLLLKNHFVDWLCCAANRAQRPAMAAEMQEQADTLLPMADFMERFSTVIQL
jgi:hypothetical protein